MDTDSFIMNIKTEDFLVMMLKKDCHQIMNLIAIIHKKE